jgi:signal transduction histidine kinase
MKGYVDFLLKGKMGNINEKQHDALLRISENAVRLGSFISDILDYTRIKSGRVDLIKENIDMAKVIKETVRLIEPLAEKKLIILGTQVPDSPVEFMGDEKNLERVLHNLISNAIKFTPEKGQITIALEDKKKELIVSVSDNGVGIPPEDIDSIFERFHQVKDHVKLVQTRGTGLGLAIVKGIVDAHGGKVWVESKLNKGSTFYFSLPKDTSSRELAPSASVVSLKYLDI